jgi:hypothetical protein
MRKFTCKWALIDWIGVSRKARPLSRYLKQSHYSSKSMFFSLIVAGNTNWKGKAQCSWPHQGSLFCKRVNNVCNVKSSWSKLVSLRRSTVLSLPLQWGFPDHGVPNESCLHLPTLNPNSSSSRFNLQPLKPRPRPQPQARAVSKMSQYNLTCWTLTRLQTLDFEARQL